MCRCTTLGKVLRSENEVDKQTTCTRNQTCDSLHHPGRLEAAKRTSALKKSEREKYWNGEIEGTGCVLCMLGEGMEGEREGQTSLLEFNNALYQPQHPAHGFCRREHFPPCGFFAINAPDRYLRHFCTNSATEHDICRFKKFSQTASVDPRVTNV